MSQNPVPQDTDQVNVNGVCLTHLEIFKVVDEFYSLIQQDPILKVPFQSVHDWPDHVKRLTHFWWIRFGGRPYLFAHYDPVGKHYFAGFNAMLLMRWLTIFHSVLSRNLSKEQADFWSSVSRKMGESLNFRNDMLIQERDNDPK